MPSGWEATGEVRWSSRWAASTRCVNLLLASNPPCRRDFACPHGGTYLVWSELERLSSCSSLT